MSAFVGRRGAVGASRVVLLAVLLACIASSVGCVSLDLLGRRRAPMRESVVYGSSGGKIAMIDIDGIITASESSSLVGRGRESTVSRVLEQLDKARDDKSVKALLLRIDTPGGGAAASDLVYSEILRFKRERGIPVVAQMMGMATSGGYYIAMSADEVRALPTTVTGSIGVVFFGVNLSGLMEKIGVANQTLTSGSYKDAGSALREMRPEERAQLTSIIDDLHRRFRHVVDEGRPALDATNIDRLADGRIYSADQALKSGLVDAVGSLESAVEATRVRAGLGEAKVVVYHRPHEWRANLYSVRGPEDAPRYEADSSSGLQIDFGALLGPGVEPGFHYLWSPAAH